MFDMSVPWWELVVRGGVVYLVLLVLVRVSGKRTLGQFTPFDLIVVMLLSEGVSNSLSGGDESLPAGLIVAATLVGLDVLASVLTSRSRKIDELVQGKPVLVGRDGEVYKEVLKRERVAEAELERALRSADCRMEDMHCAFLEADGEITILKKQG